MFSRTPRRSTAKKPSSSNVANVPGTPIPQSLSRAMLSSVTPSIGGSQMSGRTTAAGTVSAGSASGVISQTQYRTLSKFSSTGNGNGGIPQDLYSLIAQRLPVSRRAEVASALFVCAPFKSLVSAVAHPNLGLFVFTANSSSSSDSQDGGDVLMLLEAGQLPVSAKRLVFVPWSRSKLGLLCVCRDGSIFYWHDIMSQQNHQQKDFHRENLSLASVSDFVGAVSEWSTDTTGVFVACSSGKVFNLRISSNGDISFFDMHAGRQTGAGGLLSSLLGSLGGSSSSTTIKSGMSAVVLGQAKVYQHTSALMVQDVYVVGGRSVQCWSCKSLVPSDSQLVFDQRLDEDILREFMDLESGRSNNGAGLEVNFVDAALAKEGRLAALVAVVDGEALACRLGLVWLERYSGTGDNDTRGFFIKSVKYLNTPVRSIGEGFNSKLILGNGGPVAFVLTDASITVTLVYSGTSVGDDVIPFKHSLNPKLFCAIADQSKIDQLEADSENECFCMYWPHGILSLNVRTHALLKESLVGGERPTSSTAGGKSLNRRRVQEIKTLLEQAIIYGQQQENSVAFELDQSSFHPAEISNAVIELTGDVVSSSLTVLEPITDVRNLLMERSNLLQDLLHFLQSTNVLSQLHESSKLYLIWSLEKIQCALSLWSHHSSIGSSYYRDVAQPPSAQHRLIEHAIETCLSAYGDGSRGYAAVRGFFKSHVANISDVIYALFNQIMAGNRDEREVSFDDLYWPNRILIDLFEEILSVRERWHDALNLNAGQSSWIATEQMGDILQEQFEMTFNMVKKLMSQEGLRGIDLKMYENTLLPNESVITGNDAFARVLPLQNQLCELGMNLIYVFQQLISLSYHHVETRSHDAIMPRFNEQKVQVAQALAKVGKIETAYDVASGCEDYHTLADLVFQYENDPNSILLSYLKRHQEPFANAYFDYLISKNNLKELLELPIEYDAYLPSYFDREHMLENRWMFYMKAKNYKKAAQDLYQKALDEKVTEEKHNLLSLSKLTFLAAYQSSQIPIDIGDRNVSDINSMLMELDGTTDVVMG